MYPNFFKRIFDFIFAIIISPFLLFLLIGISPLIYFEDRGPVFYRQKRRGLNGSTFQIFKFRTMAVNAPDLRASDGSTWNAEDDPRVTQIGRFLRQTSLDEVPQILNILLGDMSFIGPRPTLATENYNQYSEIKKKRLQVKPGLTGYSQAYYRNSISAREKFEKDCYYVDHLNFFMDLKIIFRTIYIVVKRKDIIKNDDAV